MGFVLDFDAKNNILRVRLEGRATDATVSDVYVTVVGYTASHPPCRAIVDVSGVTAFEVSSSAIRRLVEAAPAFPIESMRIYVAPQAHVFGMARMFQILGENTRPNLHIVHTMDEAYRLLQVESPEFDPIS